LYTKKINSRNFRYLFGSNLPDCLGAIEVDTGKAILFIPKLPEEYAVWLGVIRSTEYFKEKFALDDV
jgi:Xaa-Pro dipeptidase